VRQYTNKVVLLTAGAVVAIAASIWLGPAGGSKPLVLGPPIDVSRAVDLAAVLLRGEATDAETPRDDATGAAVATGGVANGDVIVRGTVGEVCRSSGCWFVLTQNDGGDLRELYVDLKSGAGFTVPPDISGRPAVVAGRLVGDWPDVHLAARSVVVSPLAP